MDQELPVNTFHEKTNHSKEFTINQEKDQKSHKFDKPLRFQCLKCGACCADKNTLVNLTFSDILQIQKYLELNLSELLNVIGFYIFEEEPTEDQLKKLVVPPILTQRGKALVALKKDQKGRCIYLDDTNLCKIYEARPNICRTFPFHFHSIPKEKPKPHMDIEMNYAKKAIEYCPGIGSPNTLVKSTDWLGIGEKTVKDILAENILIHKWNEAVEAKKIQALAESYIQTILAMQDSPQQKTDPKKKKSYQQIAKEKLRQRSKKPED